MHCYKFTCRNSVVLFIVCCFKNFILRCKWSFQKYFCFIIKITMKVLYTIRGERTGISCQKRYKTLPEKNGETYLRISSSYTLVKVCKPQVLKTLWIFLDQNTSSFLINATTIQLYAKCDLHWYWIILKLDYKFWLTSTVLKSVTYFKIKKLQIQKVNIFMQLKNKE